MVDGHVFSVAVVITRDGRASIALTLFEEL
jgi:hypothetical protein